MSKRIIESFLKAVEELLKTLTATHENTTSESDFLDPVTGAKLDARGEPIPVVEYECMNKKRNKNQKNKATPSNVSCNKNASYHKKFNARGISFKSALKGGPRQNYLQYIPFFHPEKEVFHLQEYVWEGKPAFYIIRDRLNADVGVVPAQLVDRFHKYYHDDRYDIKLTCIGVYSPEDKKDDFVVPEFLFEAYKK